MLKIDGTFLPQTGEFFWPVLAEEFSVCCGCKFGSAEPALLPAEHVLRFPPLGEEDPTTRGDGDWLLVGICCPWCDKPDLELLSKDIWV